MTLLTSWGKYPYVEAQEQFPDKLTCNSFTTQKCIPRGLGRSYGDSALFNTILCTERLQRFGQFDPQTGLLTCDSGISLEEIIQNFVPRGWFLSVTPGTKYVTVGGAIASDVHGKNHHIDGCFSEHVEELSISINGKLITCSRMVNSDLFYATCGGMGLTGLIVNATIRLKPIKSAYIQQKVIKAKNLDHVLELFKQYNSYTYSVAWIDCLSVGNNLGRSILMLGEHAHDGKLNLHHNGKLNVPIDMPSGLLNQYTVQAFNSLYYGKFLKEEMNNTVHYDQFFYPLDGIHNWNRMYGKKGFTQYQFVIPYEFGKEGLTRILTEIAKSKQGSFLAVLKYLGSENSNYISFPVKGYTLALDFKLTEQLLPLLERLDKIVAQYNGRIYLSKDVRMSEETFKHCYPNWELFQNVRKKYGANQLFSSLQSQRIGL